MDGGVVSVGDFGSEGRTVYSAIGTQTDLIARIQDHCVPGRVLISHTTWALVKDQIPCKERGEIEVNGCMTRCESTRCSRKLARDESVRDRLAVQSGSNSLFAD
jgi:class 3 adenylate cyclase